MVDETSTLSRLLLFALPVVLQYKSTTIVNRELVREQNWHDKRQQWKLGGTALSLFSNFCANAMLSSFSPIDDLLLTL